MNDISAISPSLTGVRPGTPVRRAPVSVDPSSVVTARGGDTVSLSTQARNSDQVRPDLVERVRSEIRSEDYITDEKIDKVIDGLLRDLYA